MTLFMVLLGCAPKNRNVEQHDVYFGIADSWKELVPEIKTFWPEPKLHLDAYREVTSVNGYTVKVVPRQPNNTGFRLFFINLGGYKPHEFEEFHYKMIIAAANKTEAIQQSKETSFYKHTGFKGANSHIDDKYGVDVDDVFEIADILPASVKERYSIIVEKPVNSIPEDEVQLGYFKLDSL